MGKKNIFILLIAIGVIFFLGLIISMLGSKSSKKAVKGPAEFKVRVVGDETAGYSDILTSFKKKYPEFAKTDIKVTKFSNYVDYEKILLNVMGDGNGPDVFVINNQSVNLEGKGLLESKIVGLPNDVVDQDYFEKNFNKIFDELVIQTEQENEKGEKVKVGFLKGVPMGFESLGIFYNFKKVKNIPETWSELDKELIDNKQDDYSTIGIGYGKRYVINPTDILTLLFLQNGIKDYTKLDDSSVKSSYDGYISYGTDKNNGLSLLKDEMDSLRLTTTDLFVRGKIGIIIGYPSLMHEILASIKRVSGEASVTERYLRTSPVFQLEKDGKNVNNMAYYNFFVLSKYSKNQESGFKFLSFLSTKEAQDSYMKNFNYYLPAYKGLEEDRLSQPVEKGYDRTKLKDFYPDGVDIYSFNKGLKNEYDQYFDNILDQPAVKSQESLDNAKKYLDCSINHIINEQDLDKPCN